MPVVVKGYSVSFCIVSVDSGCGDNRSAEIPPNVFDYLRGVTTVGFGIDIKAVIMISINGRGCLFKGIGEFSAEFMKECCLKSITHEYVIKMGDITPQTAFAQSTFGKKAVDMRIPLQVSAKGVEDEDKAGSEQFRFVLFVEHTENDTSDSRKKAVEEAAVFQKERPEFFCDSKDTVSVLDVDNFKRHGGGAVYGVFISASGTETAFTTKRDKLKVTTFGASVHGPTIRRVTTMNHSVDVFDNRTAGMGSIFNFFIMVNNDVLQYIHKTIMRENDTKRNPSRLRGRGVEVSKTLFYTLFIVLPFRKM